MKSCITTILRSTALAFAATSAMPVSAGEPPALLRAAIRNGTASGVVDGPVADESRLKLNATGPLTLKVTRLYEFQQADCARLRMTFTQAQALPTGAKTPLDYSWSTELSICTDGQAPASQTRKRP